MKQKINSTPISSQEEKTRSQNIIIYDNSIKPTMKYQPNQYCDIEVPRVLLDTIKNLIADQIKDNNFELKTKFFTDSNGEYIVIHLYILIKILEFVLM